MRSLLTAVCSMLLFGCAAAPSGPDDTPGDPPGSDPAVTSPGEFSTVCGRSIAFSVHGLRAERDSALLVYHRGSIVHISTEIGLLDSLRSVLRVDGDDDDTLRLDFVLLQYGGGEEWIGSRTLYRHLPLRLQLTKGLRRGWRYETDADGLPVLSSAIALQHDITPARGPLAGLDDWVALNARCGADADTAVLRVDHRGNLAMHRPLRFLLKRVFDLLDATAGTWTLDEGKADGWLTVASFVDDDGCPMPVGLWPSVIARTDGARLTVGGTSYDILARGALRSNASHIGTPQGKARVYQYDIAITLDDGRRLQSVYWTFWFTSTHQYILRMVLHPASLAFDGATFTLPGRADYIDP